MIVTVIGQLLVIGITSLFSAAVVFAVVTWLVTRTTKDADEGALIPGFILGFITLFVAFYFLAKNTWGF